LKQYLLEFLPSPSYFATYNEYGVPLYWILLSAMLAVSLYEIFTKKPDITELAILAGVGYFSFTQMRYVAFFVIWSVPVISSFLSRLNRRLLIKAMTFCFSIVVVFYFLAVQHDWIYVKNMKFLKTDQWIPENFPDSGASFIKESGLKGNMFNFYDWGGYLIWRLSPERKVFSDGRQLSEEAFLQTLSILYAVEEPNVGGKPFYKALLDDYQVTYIIVPLNYADGEMIPLTQKMINNGQWSVVFSSANTIIFVKHTPENEPLIDRYGTDRTRFLNNLFFTIDLSIMINPYDFRLYITKGDLLVGQNMLNEARQAYEKALEIVPFNIAVRRRLNMLNQSIGR
jgi:hypothetical protein